MSADPYELNFNEDEEQMDFNEASNAPRVSEQMYLDLDPTYQNSED